MKKVARFLLWLAFALILVQFGSLSGEHHGIAIADGTRLRDMFTCTKHQAILLDLDKAGWTAPQREALESMCDFPSIWRDVNRPTFSGFIAIGILLLAGSLLYIAAKIRQAWKARRIE